MYDVLLNNSSVGFAQVEKEGLYLKMYCKTKISDDRIYRIKVNDGFVEMELGVCVPEEDCFVIRKRIPAKYFHSNDFHFTVIANDNKGISVASGQPFSAIDKLETARLKNTNGQLQIIIN